MFEKVNFSLLGEFDEKIEYKNDDFKKGCFFKFVFEGGFQEFQTDSESFKNCTFVVGAPYRIDGVLRCQAGKISLSRFTYRPFNSDAETAEGKEDEKLLQFGGGMCSGVVTLDRDGYERRDSGEFIPQVRLHCLGFELKTRLPEEVYNVTPDNSQQRFVGRLFLRGRSTARNGEFFELARWTIDDVSIHEIEPLRRLNREARRRPEVKEGN